MDNAVLRKRLMTFKGNKGNLIKVSDDLLFDIIRCILGFSYGDADKSNF